MERRNRIAVDELMENNTKEQLAMMCLLLDMEKDILISFTSDRDLDDAHMAMIEDDDYTDVLITLRQSYQNN